MVTLIPEKGDGKHQFLYQNVNREKFLCFPVQKGKQSLQNIQVTVCAYGIKVKFQISFLRFSPL